MSGRFDVLVRDFESCQTQDACAAQLTHARFAATRQQIRLIIVSLKRCSRTRRTFWPTCPTLLALPIPLCLVLLSPRSVDQWNTSAQMPIQMSQICHEIQAPWSLERCTCGGTQSVSVRWYSCHADMADLFVLLFVSQGCS